MSDIFNIDFIPTDIWLDICSKLSIKSLYALRATCRGLRSIVDDRSVWHSALSDLVEIKDAAYSREDLESMSAPELREASVRIIKVDRAFRSPKLPHKKAPIPASIDTSSQRWLVTTCKHPRCLPYISIQWVYCYCCHGLQPRRLFYGRPVAGTASVQVHSS
ncbi:hypothetical protein BC629DRAFT_313555 [Irpex lacteus]|nr:hypothetical protein BC629DRAFT_313555 [Irpex lacteus]